MHAIQTSGNCIRNITTDQFAGAAADEIIDPRPVAEILRQWSSLHPEFSYLPRKFKIAMSGGPHDRAAIRFHDIGLQAATNASGEIGWEVWVGGGLGRTPMIAKLINGFVPHEHLLAYLESILRVYNRYGRRDNKYKARIKILVHETGIDKIREEVEEEFAAIKGGVLTLPQDELDRITAYFAAPGVRARQRHAGRCCAREDARPGLWRVARPQSHSHRQPGYASVTISLKPIGGAPGDATAEQMDAVADLAERYSFDELRVTHEQNLVLPHVADHATFAPVYDALLDADLETGNAGLITDMITCPGLDFCALANARSIPIAQEISPQVRARPSGSARSAISRSRFRAASMPAATTMSATSAFLGVEKKGTELYQISVGGDATEKARRSATSSATALSPRMCPARSRSWSTSTSRNAGAERAASSTAYRRLGEAPFKEALYGNA